MRGISEKGIKIFPFLPLSLNSIFKYKVGAISVASIHTNYGWEGGGPEIYFSKFREISF